MTDFNIEIIQQPSYSLDVTTGTSGIDSPTVEVVTSGGVYLEVSNRDKILPSDFPDTYPISWTTGLLPIGRVSGLYAGSNIVFSSGIDGSLTINSNGEAYRLVTTVFNRSQSPIPKFSVVYISGGQGDLPIISLALANGEPKSSKTFGVTEEIIPAMSSGRVVSYGNIIQVNTDAYNINAPQGDVNGQVLYLSPTVSGGLTITKPYAPNHLVAVGTVIRTHQNEGVFNVRIQNGFELEELHNVATTGATSGQFIKYNGSLWRNSTLASSDISDFSSAVSGISPNITISGTSGISVDKNGNAYTVYTTGSFGLTSPQVQQLLNSGVSINVISGTGNFNLLSVTGIPVSLSGHTHTSSQITDFNASVNNLISVKNVSGSGYVNVLATTGNYIVSVSGLQPTGNYSLAGHSHLVSDITNFSSGVSGLLPFTGIIGSGYVNVNTLNRVATISVSGLQPSGNYSVSGHTHTASNITDFNSATSGLLAPYALLSSGNFTNLYVTGIPVSLSGHTHSLSGISSGLIYDDNGNIFIGTDSGTVNLDIKGSLSVHDLSIFYYDILANKINASELFAPIITTDGITGGSGNFSTLKVGGTDVSLSGHTHTSSSITDFNSSVSGLLPVTNIIGTSGASVTSSGTVFTVAVTGSFGLTTSEIQTLLNSGVSINAVSGTGNFNSLSVIGIPVSVSGHSHTLTIGSGSGIAITYDSSQTLNIVGSGNSTVSYDNVNKTVLISSSSTTTATRGYEILGSGKSIFTVDGGYVVGNIDVFYNGVKLLNGSDFTATNGTTFALAVSGITGDIVEWNAFSTAPRYQVVMGEVRSDFVSGVNYIGNALQGSSESDSVWRIKKTTISSDGEILNNLTATNVRWTDRLIETYI